MLQCVELCLFALQNLELGMTLPIQTHVLMQSQGNSQILIPVSPRPEDVPAHWLTPNDTQNSSEVSTSSAGTAPV